MLEFRMISGKVIDLTFEDPQKELFDIHANTTASGWYIVQGHDLLINLNNVSTIEVLF